MVRTNELSKCTKKTNFEAVSKKLTIRKNTSALSQQAKTYSTKGNLLERIGKSMLNMGSTRTAERRLVVEADPQRACEIGQKKHGETMKVCCIISISLGHV